MNKRLAALDKAKADALSTLDEWPSHIPKPSNDDLRFLSELSDREDKVKEKPIYSHKLKEVRCTKCNKLLGHIDGYFEIKCPRCKEVNAKPVITFAEYLNQLKQKQ